MHIIHSLARKVEIHVKHNHLKGEESTTVVVAFRQSRHQFTGMQWNGSADQLRHKSVCISQQRHLLTSVPH